jgi:hypothetical protein
MYFRAPHRDADATHIFPRGKDGMGGVILGGCREKNNWNGEVDLEFAEVIKRKCCALVPQLGKPENLKVIKHGVGLRRTYPTFLTRRPKFPISNSIQPAEKVVRGSNVSILMASLSSIITERGALGFNHLGKDSD